MRQNRKTFFSIWSLLIALFLSSPLLAVTVLTQYIYDSAGRVTGATYTQNGVGSSHRYSYDNLGNILEHKNGTGLSGTIYVNANATGANTGNSWEDAFTDLQSALAAVNPNSEIWVARGIYRPGTARTATFRLKANVKLYGGFAGMETSRDSRDPKANSTTLSGDLNGNDSGYANRSDNAYHVITGADNAVIDGFVIMSGCADGTGNDRFGGGMINIAASTAVTNCTFTYNTAVYGGGVFNSLSSPVMTSCLFTYNKAETSGGGMYSSGSSPYVYYSRIDTNTAASGGAFASASSSGVFMNCLLSSNNADQYGGAMHVSGNYAPTLMNCTISRNSASIDGGGVCSSSSAQTAFTNCILWENSSGGEHKQLLVSSGSFPSLSYCDIDEDGYEGANGNIRTDPLLDDDFHIMPGSPCIDSADPSSAPPAYPAYDMDSEDRPQGGRYDIGADEYKDSDNDDMPDWWELLQFGNLGQGKTSDWDRDGLLDKDEYLHGGDPKNPDTNGNGLLDGYESSLGADLEDTALTHWSMHGSLVNAFPGALWKYALNRYKAAIPVVAGSQTYENVTEINPVDVNTFPCTSASGTGQFTSVSPLTSSTADVLEKRFVQSGTVSGAISGTIVSSHVEYKIQSGPSPFVGVTIGRADWECGAYTGTTYYYSRSDSDPANTYFGGSVEGDVHGETHSIGTDGAGYAVNRVMMTSLGGTQNTGSFDIVWNNSGLHVIESSLLHTGAQITYQDVQVSSVSSGCLSGSTTLTTGTVFYLPELNAGHFKGTWALQGTDYHGPTYSYGCVQTDDSLIVPRLVGLSLESAEDLLNTQGFKAVRVSSEYSSTIPEGGIISQSLTPGNLVDPEGTITLLVSKGPQPPSSPVCSIVGLTSSQARNMLTSCGFTLGSISEEYSVAAPAGIILRQNPAAGSLVPLGTSINIVISKGSPSSQLTPWSMFKHDSKHTGRSSYIGPQTPTQRWVFSTNSVVRGSPVIGSDGTVYVGNYDCKLYALDGNTGAQKWAFLTGTGIDLIYGSPAVGTDGTVYIGNWNNKFFAINATTGAQKWVFSTSNANAHFRTPAIGSNGTVYIGADKLYALNGSTGSKIWEFTMGDTVVGAPAVADDGTVYVASTDRKVYALNGATGAQKWVFTTGNYVLDSSPAIGSDGTVYIGSYDGKVYALDGSTGALKWSFITGNPVYSSPSIGADGTVYVGSNDFMLYALDGANGAVKWSFATGYYIQSGPTIDGSGTVYVGSFDGKMYALNGADGALKWSFNAGAQIKSSPAIGPDGTLYFGCDDNNVYALGPGTALVAVPSGGSCDDIEAAGFQCSFSHACSTTVPFGEIISQSPIPGTLVQQGSMVSFVLSSGPCPVTIPAVQSCEELIAMGLVCNKQTECSDVIPSGEVISQTPAAGEMAEPGTSVTLKISSGYCPVIVPTALSLEDITAAGLVYDTIQQCSNTVPVGGIISQSPAAGTTVARGSLVTLIISTGHCPVPVPTATSCEEITAAGLVCDLKYECSNTVASGIVISIDPAPGTIVAAGSKVSLVISNGPCPCTITASSGTRGSISPSGQVVVQRGGSQAFTMTPSTRCKVTGVLADGSSVLSQCVKVSGGLKYTFTNVTSDHTISASFALIGDLNNDGKVTLAEAMSAVNSWKAGTMSLSDAMAAIQNWKNVTPAQAMAMLTVDTPPTASIVSPSSPTTITTGQTVSFQGGASGTSTPFTYAWSIPGGSITSSTALSPGAVKFTKTGTYTITFTVTDSKGLTGSATTTVTVVKATAYYVSSGGNNKNDGSKTNPFATIQYALDVSQGTSSSPMTIYVAAGSYYENIVMDSTCKYVTVIGGWDSGFTTRRSGRTVIDGGGNNGPCVIMDSVGLGVVMDGIVIYNGYANGSTLGTEAGGMVLRYSSPTITNCLFLGNYGWNGGGLSAYSSAPTITNCVFNGNRAQVGAGMFNQGSSPTIVNCTFVNNVATQAGGGMYNYSNSNPVVRNCIFWNDTAPQGGEIYNYGSTPDVGFSLIKGGYADGNSILNLNPLFTNMVGSDNIICSFDDDMRLQQGSPCIDAGSNTANALPGSDFNGYTRVIDGNGDGSAVVDLGAFENIGY